MLKIMILEDIKEIPQGFTLWGSIPDSHGKNPQEIADQINQSLDALQSLTYLDRKGNHISLPIKDFQITSSIGGNFVLVFLLPHLDLPSDLTPGTVLYRSQLPSSNANISESLVTK